jgi:hypothetical protein
MKRWNAMAIVAPGAEATVLGMGISGTVILCDQVYQAQGGKFVLAGTYTTIEVRVADLRAAEHRLDNLAVYVRLRPEQLGVLPCELLVRDEQRPPWDEPLMRVRWDPTVTHDNIRLVECAFVLPPVVVRVQANDPAAVPPPRLEVRYVIELRAAGEVVGATPLDLRFVLTPRPG